MVKFLLNYCFLCGELVVMINKFNPEIKEALLKNELVIFVGAGLSTNFGFPSWKDLVKEILEMLIEYDGAYRNYLPLLDDPAIDILTILGFIKIKGDEKKVRDYIEERFTIPTSTTTETLQLHRKLFEVSQKVITTNYDGLLEDASGIKKVCYNNRHRVSNLNTYDNYIFKIHGDYEEAAECILFLDDYKALYEKDHAAINELKNLIRNSTIIFVGFSLSDPFVTSIFKYIKELYDGLIRSHYVLTTSNDDFSEFGVKTLKLDSYNEIDGYLEELINIKKKN